MTLAAAIILATALGGLSLYALYAVIRPHGRVWWPGALHGVAGIAGLALLVRALGVEPPRGLSSGAGSFGTIAAVLIGAGLLLGLAAFAARWRRRPAGMLLLGSHATLAVAGLTMLAAYLSAPS